MSVKLLSALSALALTAASVLCLSSCSAKQELLSTSGFEKEQYFDYETDTFSLKLYSGETLAKEFVLDGFDGEPLEVIVYESNSRGLSEKEYVYDTAVSFDEFQSIRQNYYEGDKLTKTVYCDKNENMVSIFKYEYTDSGKIFTKDVIGDTSLRKNFYRYSYNNYDNLIMTQEYDAATELTGYRQYKYDSDGLLMSEEYYSESDELIEKYSYKFAEPDKLLKKQCMDASGELLWEKLYEYDKDMNVIGFKSSESAD